MAIEAKHNNISFGVGDVVRIHSKSQIFQGTVISIGGHGDGKSFTVRRIGEGGIGIEMIFPFNSPSVSKVEVVRDGKRGVRRAKLYYIRNKSKKEIDKIYTRARRRMVAKIKNEPKKPVIKKSSKKLNK